jgi:hypothetical protein
MDYKSCFSLAAGLTGTKWEIHSIITPTYILDVTPAFTIIFLFYCNFEEAIL